MKNLLKLGTALTRAEQKMVNGGQVELESEDSCYTAELPMSCDCNGTWLGCVASIQACWNMCS